MERDRSPADRDSRRKIAGAFEWRGRKIHFAKGFFAIEATAHQLILFVGNKAACAAPTRVATNVGVALILLRSFWSKAAKCSMSSLPTGVPKGAYGSQRGNIGKLPYEAIGPLLHLEAVTRACDFLRMPQQQNERNIPSLPASPTLLACSLIES